MKNGNKIVQYWDYEQPTKCTIICDWFEVSGTCDSYHVYHDLDKEFEGKKPFTQTINDRISITFMGYGIAAYMRSFQVSIGSLTFGHLYAVPRRSEFMEPTRVSFKINNEWLYTNNWVEKFYEVLKALQVTVTNVTRMDVAVDGCNKMLGFLSDFSKQKRLTKEVQRVGQAKFTTVALNEKSMIYGTVYIGSRQSEKFLRVYHKSSELERSHKMYIKKFWEANGLPTFGVNRIEIELKSKYLQAFPEFLKDVNNVANPKKLARLFFRATERYFDFRLMNDVNITRCTPIELVPKNILVSVPLDEIEIPVRDGLYGTKQVIKANVLHILKKLTNGNEDHYREVIRNDLDLYSLHDWYEKRLPLWQRMVDVNERTGHDYDLESLVN